MRGRITVHNVLMIERYFHNNITWLDVVSPTAPEIHGILEECNIPREFGNDLTTMTPKTEVFSKKGFLKITLDFPIVKRTDINHPHEVKFLVTKTHLVTIRFEDIEAMHHFAKEYEVLCMLKGKQKASTETLFVTMLNYFYDALHQKLDYLDSKLKDIDEEVFKEREREMVFELSNVSRRLIVFRQTISAHQNALSKLSVAMKDAFTKNYDEQCESLIHHYEVLTRRVHALIATHDDLRNTNDSLLTTKQNEIMKFLTVISFITFPLMLFTSMFGMNTVNTPIVGHRFDYWIIVAIMIVVSVILLIYFKFKRWL